MLSIGGESRKKKFPKLHIRSSFPTLIATTLILEWETKRVFNTDMVTILLGLISILSMLAKLPLLLQRTQTFLEFSWLCGLKSVMYTLITQKCGFDQVQWLKGYGRRHRSKQNHPSSEGLLPRKGWWTEEGFQQLQQPANSVNTTQNSVDLNIKI